MLYAQQSYDYLVAHGPPDWEIAFARAVLAHAAFAAGDVQRHKQHHATAAELGGLIGDPEDKDIFLKTFRLIPVPR